MDGDMAKHRMTQFFKIEKQIKIIKNITYNKFARKLYYWRDKWDDIIKNCGKILPIPMSH